MQIRFDIPETIDVQTTLVVPHVRNRHGWEVKRLAPENVYTLAFSHVSMGLVVYALTREHAGQTYTYQMTLEVSRVLRPVVFRPTLLEPIEMYQGE
jgi:hypothetical protein